MFVHELDETIQNNATSMFSFLPDKDLRVAAKRRCQPVRRGLVPHRPSGHIDAASDRSPHADDNVGAYRLPS